MNQTIAVHAPAAGKPNFTDWVIFSTVEHPASYVFLSQSRGLLVTHIVAMLFSTLILLPLALFTPARKRLPRWSTRLARPAIQVALCLALLMGVGAASLHHANTPELYPGAFHRKAGFALVLYVLVTYVASLASSFKAWAQRRRQRVGVGFMPLQAQEDAPMHSLGDRSPTRSFQSAQSQETLHCLETDETRPGCGEHVDLPRTPQERLQRLGLILHKVFLTGAFYSQLLLGIVTLGGLFQEHEIFNGLAHWIKASVFFIFGIWVFLRYLGITASSGMAWNAAASESQAIVAEKIECSLIFTYGVANVFLERLGHSQAPISATDIQHMSIALLFAFAGGIGLLLESQTLQRLITRDDHAPRRPVFNIMPALVTFFTGLLMSQHHQDTAFASTVHAIWGYFFCIASLFRILTNLALFMRPETLQDRTPSRPPTEALVAFSLIAGAIVFMASSRDTVQALEYYGLHAFFLVSLAAAGALGVLVWTCFLAVLMHLSA